ncbi:porin family protein [Reichenbachiella sp. MALMAid0571]|uniref:porin family protein n=1 Tax=Reichenbachiella sp. MALMAid0571 TaxID=3143939 RepID=UPI0032DEBCBA
MQNTCTYLLVFAVLISLNASAQSSVIGLKGGLNIATIAGDADGVSSKLGIHIGFYNTMEISESFKFQPELIFSMQGAQVAQGEGKVNYNYINVPLIAKIFVQNGFNFQFGPQVGILLSANVSDGMNSISVKDQLNSTDFSLGLGIGYELESGVNFDLRYNLGLSNTSKEDSNDTYPNSVIQFSIGKSF